MLLMMMAMHDGCDGGDDDVGCGDGGRMIVVMTVVMVMVVIMVMVAAMVVVMMAMAVL